MLFVDIYPQWGPDVSSMAGLPFNIFSTSAKEEGKVIKYCLQQRAQATVPETWSCCTWNPNQPIVPASSASRVEKEYNEQKETDTNSNQVNAAIDTSFVQNLCLAKKISGWEWMQLLMRIYRTSKKPGSRFLILEMIWFLFSPALTTHLTREVTSLLKCYHEDIIYY